jgi:tetratricopeptide (TPR) repeat protein
MNAMFWRRLIISVIGTVFFLDPVAAQQRNQTRKQVKHQDAISKEASLLRLNATYLLRSLGQSGNEIENVSDRVRVLGEIGDGLWNIDHDDARAVLLRSFQEIDKLLSGSDQDRERAANQVRFLRRTILSRIARHDPALANQLIQNLPKEPATADQKQMQLEGVSSPNGEALLGIADNLLASDTKRAAALAGYSLQDGLSQRLRLFLIDLRAKDPAAADSLVEAALRQASIQHPGRLFDVMLLWDYVYQPADFYLNGIIWDREGSERRYQPSPVLKRAVLTFAVTAVLENLQVLGTTAEAGQDHRFALSLTTSLFSVIQQLLPTMQVDLPQGAIDLQQAQARVIQELQTTGQTPPQRPDVKGDTDSYTSVIDSLLEKAGEASQGEARDSLYLGAAFKLLQSGKYERAKEVAARIDDLDQRAMLLEPLNFYLAKESIEKGNFNEALSTGDQLKTPELRISTFAAVATGLIDKGKSQEALEAVTEVRNSASKAEPTIEVAAATLRVASALTKGDPVRASEFVSLAIQIANKTQDQSLWPLLSPLPSPNTLTFSWTNAPTGGLKSVKASHSRSGGLAEMLSKLEFEHAVSLARELKSKGVSLAVQAAICRAALESTEPKISAGRAR